LTLPRRRRCSPALPAARRTSDPLLPPPIAAPPGATHPQGGAGRGASLWALLPGILREGAAFGLLSGGVFMGLNLGCYALYGRPFLEEAFLHHLTRRDPRHNFSVYFYHIYLTYMAGGPIGGAIGGPVGGAAAAAASAAASTWADPARLAFFPQLGLALALAWAFRRHLPFAWLLQTLAFVALNKVSTAQYFVWYFSLLPLVLPALPARPPAGLAAAAAAWVATQLHWLGWGYALEFGGARAFLGLWAASGAFLAANAALMVALMASFAPRSSFLACSLAATRKRGKQT